MVPRQSRRPGTDGGLFSHSQEPAIGKLSLDLGCRGFWESGKKCGAGGPKTLRSTGVPVKPHLHMVHHHLVGQVAAVLGLVHLFVQERLRGEREKDGAGVGGCDTLRMPELAGRGPIAEVLLPVPLEAQRKPLTTAQSSGSTPTQFSHWPSPFS